MIFQIFQSNELKRLMSRELLKNLKRIKIQNCTPRSTPTLMPFQN